ncbi:MAG: MTH1187 family thiamine-binding protein [Acidimicrobiales bacterium]
MHAMIDLCVVPIGVGVSVSRYIAACEQVLLDAGLEHQLHPYGTTVAGPWDEVFAAVKRCHEVVHRLGAPRIHTNLKIGTRTDREQTMAEKVASVEAKLAAGQLEAPPQAG